MTLDEAIQHAREKQHELSYRAQILGENDAHYKSCIECSLQHQQLAEWLEELKAFREKNNT